MKRCYCFATQLAVLFVCCNLIFSCTSSRRGLFATRTPHERYADNLTNAGLQKSALGIQWFTAAANSLQKPLTVQLPYKENGYFAAERPDAAGYLFTCKRGETVMITLQQKPVTGFTLFMDLWQNTNGSNQYLQSADTMNHTINYEVNNDGSYLIRLQPELLASAEYTITITTGPTLAFPVPASFNPHVGSIWGDNRDAGIRKHEGIDIFAKFRTPVTAAANGYITRVNENKLGGKVVFMRPEGKDYTLYYAHLDSQIVSEGMEVKTGDVLGLMGNTGNARTTPTHLHFGIYALGGAVNPLPFISQNRAEPKPVTASAGLFQQYVRTTKPGYLYNEPAKNNNRTALPVNSLLQVEAATSSWYKVSLPDSNKGFINSDNVSAKPFRKYTLQADKNLYDQPDTSAASKTLVSSGKTVDVLATNKSFFFVKYNELTGWIAQ